MFTNVVCTCGHRFRIQGRVTKASVQCPICGERVALAAPPAAAVPPRGAVMSHAAEDDPLELLGLSGDEEVAAAPASTAEDDPLRLLGLSDDEAAGASPSPKPVTEPDIYRLADEPLPPRKVPADPRPAAARECPWCKLPLAAGQDSCRSCGWGLDRPKKPVSKAARARLAQAKREADRRLGGYRPLDPVTWGQILRGPFNLLRVFVPALGLSLEWILLAVFAPLVMAVLLALGFSFAAQNNDTLRLVGYALLVPALLLPFFVLGHTINHYLAVGHRAAAQDRWDRKAMGNLRAAGFYLLVLLVGVLPLLGVAIAYAASTVPGAVRDLPSWPWLAGGAAALLWAVYYVPMAMTATAATHTFTVNPLEVGRWVWKCFPHTTLCYLLLPLYTAVMGCVMVVLVAAVPFLVRPSLWQDIETIRDQGVKLVERERAAPGHIEAEVKKLLNRPDQIGKDLQLAALLCLLAALVPLFIVNYAAVAFYHQLGLIARRREPVLGWHDGVSSASR